MATTTAAFSCNKPIIIIYNNRTQVHYTFMHNFIYDENWHEKPIISALKLSM